MKKWAFLSFVLCLSGTSLTYAQKFALPRNPDRLVERAQNFWSAVVSGQRLGALQFVLPEKKNLFLTGNPVPLLKAEVLGIDLTADPTQARVRIRLDLLSVATPAGRLDVTITDPWILQGGTWYINLQSPADI